MFEKYQVRLATAGLREQERVGASASASAAVCCLSANAVDWTKRYAHWNRMHLGGQSGDLTHAARFSQSKKAPGGRHQGMSRGRSAFLHGSMWAWPWA